MYNDLKAIAADLRDSSGKIAKTYAERNTSLQTNDSTNRANLTHAIQQSSRYDNFIKIRCTGPLLLLLCFGFNKAASTNFYIQFFDSFHKPIDGTPCDFEVYSAATDNWSIGTGFTPWRFTSGLFIMVSTTSDVLTTDTTSSVRFATKYLHEGATPNI